MTHFKVWAPGHKRVRIRLHGCGPDREMIRGKEGWWQLQVPEAEAGVDYGFLLGDDPTLLPDPRSVWLPLGTDGPTRLYDHRIYRWQDGGWLGKQLAGGIIYELHIGTFTQEGTLDSAIAKLDHLVDLGIDFIELLPVNAIKGKYNWGYDGVNCYAVHEPYGGPDALKRFIDACHARGLGVILDVVYNHFSPIGAHFLRFVPYLKKSKSTWGNHINLDETGAREVRQYIIDNALMWFRDFHMDGLRLDAVQELPDQSAVHILEQLAVETDAMSTHLGRPLALIAESDQNNPLLISAREAGGLGMTARWSDDVHHAIHVLLTDERRGHYVDYGSNELLTRALTTGIALDGVWSAYRQRIHGRPMDPRLPGHRLIAFLQNHDQIGNRARGDRLSETISPGLLKIGAVLILTSPFTPMLFMGEEWGAKTPWPYFTSHPDPELADTAVARRWDEWGFSWAQDIETLHPQDPDTFLIAKLDWSELNRPEHTEILDFYRQLIAVRKNHPELSNPRLNRDSVSATVSDTRSYVIVRRSQYAVVCNLGKDHLEIPLDRSPVGVILASSDYSLSEKGVLLGPESTVIVDLGVMVNRRSIEDRWAEVV